MHPRNEAEFRADTEADIRKTPYTAHGYRCKRCLRHITNGMAGRKKVVGGEGFICPECVKK